LWYWGTRTIPRDIIREQDYLAHRIKEAALADGSKHLLMDWRVGRDIGSDHLPLMCKIRVGAAQKTLCRNKHWIHNKCDKEKYNEIVNIKLEEWESTTKGKLDINIINGTFRKIILEAARDTCPRRTRNYGHKGNPWWNSECREEIKMRTKLRRKMQVRRNFKAYAEYVRQNKKTKLIIQNAKN
jgi:hypothetical protein